MNSRRSDFERVTTLLKTLHVMCLRPSVLNSDRVPAGSQFEVIENGSKVKTAFFFFFSQSQDRPLQKENKQLTSCFIEAKQRVKDTVCNATLPLNLHVQFQKNHVTGLFRQ